MKFRIRIDFLFCFGFFIFYAFIYPYHILMKEQLSLFLYSSEHWRAYALQPGGWAAYCGDFLAQFHINRWMGALIQTLLLALLIAITNRILKKTGARGNLLLIGLLPALLLMALQCDYRFTPGDTLKFICPFALTLAYMSVSRVALRRMALLLATVPVFLFSGAPATCGLYVACVLYECLYAKDAGRYVMPAWLIAVGSLPYIWQSVYAMPDDERFACIGFQPDAGLACLPVLLLAFAPLLILPAKLIGSRRLSRMGAGKPVLAVNILLLLGCGWYLFPKAIHRVEEQKFGMLMSVSQNDWDRVLTIGKRVKTPDRLTVFFTNLALAMKDELPEKMFHFPQTDEYGLLLYHTGNDHLLLRGGSEFFYRVGVLNEAIKWIFDAPISRREGMDYHSLTRLAAWNRDNGYERTAGSYFDVLEHTLMYRSWAKQQRQIKVGIVTRQATEYYYGGREPASDLVRHYDLNPENRMVLDYLLCYLLLKNDLTRFLNLFHTCYPAETRLPKAYQEALLALDNMGKTDIRNYPVDKINEVRFRSFNQAVRQGDEKKLEKQFGNTWWYYSYRMSQ